VISTVRDQLTWARFHLGDGRSRDGARILKAATMRLMQSNLVPAGTLADHVGVSWLISDSPVRTVAHGGNVSNLQLSSFVMVPEHDLAVTVLTNAGNGRLVSDEVQRWALQRFTGTVETPPVFADVDPNDLKQYEGAYASKLSELEVVARGRRLLLTSRYNLDAVPESDREALRALLAAKPKPVELGLVAPDRAVVSRGPSLGVRGEFLRESPKGPVCWMRWGGRVHRRQVSRR
jgi:CubicO group peptidase (beta-lactamase class C family)